VTIRDFVDRSEVEEEVAQHIALQDRAILLACEGDRVAGCVAIHPLSDGDCEIKRLYVRPDFRRRGLAIALMRAAEEFARSYGYGSVYLDTKSRMVEAIALYERLGYEHIPPYHETMRADVFFRKRIASTMPSSSDV
jgi:ribosomal protein S18 acetylase RimI-like enzyme